jgi:hypothetical protein
LNVTPAEATGFNGSLLLRLAVGVNNDGGIDLSVHHHEAHFSMLRRRVLNRETGCDLMRCDVIRRSGPKVVMGEKSAVSHHFPRLYRRISDT